MKLKYFGTAAAEGIPAMFCNCRVCEASRKLGGRNLRTRSQAMVDDKILIDFPPDTYMHVLCEGLDLASVHSLIVTHDHSDHLYAADFEMRQKEYAYPDDLAPLTVYSSKASAKSVCAIIEEVGLEQNRVYSEILLPYKTYDIEGYKITPLKADHDPRCEPFIYSIDDGKKRMLYANDTGIFPEETWTYLEESKMCFDFVSLDCTGMVAGGWTGGHMSLDTNIKVRERLILIGAADENTRFCVHHFSHNGGATHDEMEAAAKQVGFLASYDGMELEI